MKNKILDFPKVFENFTGSGNINGKYWIVGLESGGKLNKNDYQSGNELALAEYLSNFNDDEIEYTGFLGYLKRILDSIGEYENCTKDSKYNFSVNGNIFRTNLYPLKQRSIDEPINEIYRKVFDLNEDINKDDLYDEQLIKKRSLTLRSSLKSENKRKTILLLIPSKNPKFINDSLLLINNIFDSDFNPINYALGKFPSQTVYYNEYSSTNKNIRVIHYPQMFSLSQSDLNTVSKSLSII